MLLQADARDLPFKEEFDLAGAFDVLEHIQDDESVLSQLRETLKPGGGLMLTVPQHPCLWSVMDEAGRHKRRYTRRDLVAKLERAGFQDIETGSFVSLLLPLMFLSRRRMPRSVEELDPLIEVRQGRTANFVLEKILLLEVFLLRAGLRPPAGGTLFAVARRPGPAADPMTEAGR